MGGVPAFKAAAARLCDMGARDLLVDITELGFVDSSGLRAILEVKDTCTKQSVHFSMTHGSGQAEKLFELTRLVDRLPFRKSGRTRPRREIELWAETPSGEEPGPQARV